MSTKLEAKLLRSWDTNAEAWASTVREHLIPSRSLGTDEAILSILASRPKGRLLDLGCGEGWLSRAAAEQGWKVTGIDVSAELIDSAREFADAEYLVMEYERIGSVASDFDCIVANFSILSEDIGPLLISLRQLLTRTGVLVIQTVHPWVACGDQPYANNWREEAFQGWTKQFPATMPWFFRTLNSWFGELTGAGFQIFQVDEPLHPATGRPLSLLLQANLSSKSLLKNKWKTIGAASC